MVDHQSLVTILDIYTLDAVENPKLQHPNERLSSYIYLKPYSEKVKNMQSWMLSFRIAQRSVPEDVAANLDVLSFFHRIAVRRILAFPMDDADHTESDLVGRFSH